jgi:hypothetical protein
MSQAKVKPESVTLGLRKYPQSLIKATSIEYNYAYQKVTQQVKSETI